MVFQTPEDARDQFFTFSSGETDTRRREHPVSKFGTSVTGILLRK